MAEVFGAFTRALRDADLEKCEEYSPLFFLVGEAYTQQGRAHIRRLRPDWAARPYLMSPMRRAAHAVESKAVVRIEDRSRRQPTPLPGLRCGGWSSSCASHLSAAASHP
jgi:hypothetical protein